MSARELRQLVVISIKAALSIVSPCLVRHLVAPLPNKQQDTSHVTRKHLLAFLHACVSEDLLNPSSDLTNNVILCSDSFRMSLPPSGNRTSGSKNHLHHIQINWRRMLKEHCLRIWSGTPFFAHE